MFIPDCIRIWIAEVLGQVKSVPSTPGIAVAPNSPPDSFTPKNWKVPLELALVDGAGVGAVSADVVVPDAAELILTEAAEVVVGNAD